MKIFWSSFLQKPCEVWSGAPRPYERRSRDRSKPGVAAARARRAIGRRPDRVRTWVVSYTQAHPRLACWMGQRFEAHPLVSPAGSVGSRQSATGARSPPPVNIVSGNRWFFCTGGGNKSIISFQRGAWRPPFDNPHGLQLSSSKEAVFHGGPRGSWCPVGTVQRPVSAPASVGAERSPLATSARAGRRDGVSLPPLELNYSTFSPSHAGRLSSFA